MGVSMANGVGGSVDADRAGPAGWLKLAINPRGEKDGMGLRCPQIGQRLQVCCTNPFLR